MFNCETSKSAQVKIINIPLITPLRIAPIIKLILNSKPLTGAIR